MDLHQDIPQQEEEPTRQTFTSYLVEVVDYLKEDALNKLNDNELEKEDAERIVLYSSSLANILARITILVDYSSIPTVLGLLDKQAKKMKKSHDRILAIVKSKQIRIKF